MKELLAPVGNFEMLKQVVHNGCDAVYLAGKEYGARKFASNFDRDEMIEAIKFCHLYGVKIYVTVNTVIFEEEIDDCLEYITFLHEKGVDAVIMQDIGMMKLVREVLPNLDIHVSTQAHNHNQKQLEMLENLGVKRVVLAREMTISEINKLNTNLELETFIHGAICISYSGQCLFSSLILNRSGNRGECAGICRLPFEFLEDGQVKNTDGNYLLSPKELNTTDQIRELMESNITSFKIEGRMKSPYTIGYIVKLYRMLIDHYKKGEEVKLTDDEVNTLKLLFNRGFTEGHLFSKSGSDLMNIASPNHIGVEIGEVVEVTNKRIKIKLNSDLNQGDGIRFFEEGKGMSVNFIYNSSDNLISSGKSGNTIEVDNKVELRGINKVLKTTDSLLVKELENYELKKIPVKIYGRVLLNQKLWLKITDDINEVEIEEDIIQVAQGGGTSKDRIIEQVLKLGNTPFIVIDSEFEIDEGVFVPISKLNEMRRTLVDRLIEIRESSKREVIKKKIPVLEKRNDDGSIKISVLVRSEEQLQVCLDEGIDYIYVDDSSLYEKYNDLDNVYLRLSRVKNNFSQISNKKLLVGEVGSVYEYGSTNEVVGDYFLNVTNSHSIKYLVNNNVKRVTLSIENSIDTISEIVDKIGTDNLEVIVYGRMEVMVMKHCPVNMLFQKGDKPCSLCKNSKSYELKDRNGEVYPLKQNNCLTHIFNYRNSSLDLDIERLLSIGVKNYRIDLFDEDGNNAVTVLKKYKTLLSK